MKRESFSNVAMSALFVVSALVSGYNIHVMSQDRPVEVKETIKTVKVVETQEDYSLKMRKQIGPSVLKLYGKRGGGTGFHVTAPSGKNYILTNAHVCELHTDHFLKADSKALNRKVKRRIIEIYDEHDLCLVEGIENVKAIKVADVLTEGESTFLIGHPKLRPLTVTRGEYIYNTTISIYYCNGYPVRTTKLTKEFNLFKDLTSGCLKARNANSITNYSKPGASGSPIVNRSGKLVGVLFAGNMFDSNDSYAVPLTVVKEFLKAY